MRRVQRSANRSVLFVEVAPTRQLRTRHNHSFNVLVGMTSRGQGWGSRGAVFRRTTPMQLRTPHSRFELVVAPSACGLLTAAKYSPLPFFNDPTSRLYSFPTTRDGRWAMIDPKPVWVPVPTSWQRLVYYLWKICSVAVGVAACAALTFALYVLPHPAKWLLLIGYPTTLWASYKVFFWGAYNSVQRWAELRAQCTSIPFSEAIKVPGVYDCLTPRELRKKLLREAMGKDVPIEFIALSSFDLATFQQAGMFSLKEIEEIAEFSRSFRNIRDQFILDKEKIDSAFGAKLKGEKDRRDQKILKAENEYYSSAELRLVREIENNYNSKRDEILKKQDQKIADIRRRTDLADAEKSAKIATVDKRYREKLSEVKAVRDIKLEANTAAVLKRTIQKDDEIKEANQVFEELRKRLYESEGMQQKYENLQRDFGRNQQSIEKQWERYVEAVLVPNEAAIPDSIERRWDNN